MIWENVVALAGVLRPSSLVAVGGNCLDGGRLWEDS